MQHSVEITEAAFHRLMAGEHTKTKIDNYEHCSKIYYTLPCGTRLLVVFNHIGSITQYYIQDINA